MSEKENKEEEKKSLNEAYQPQPKKRKIICKNCKSEIEPKGEVCPECGHYLNEGRVEYEPISKETARKIRWVLFGVLLVVAVIIFIANGTFGSCGESTARILQ